MWCDGPVEIRELRAFVAVAEAGGLSAAARRMHLSQSALSQTIAGLERQLGVPLLDRTSTGTQLTAAGASLLRDARVLLADHDRIVRDVGSHEQGGVLRVGVPLELPSDLLTAALARVGERLPDVDVQLRHLSTAQQMAELRADALDVALVRERVPDSRFDAMLVVTEHLGALITEDLVEQLVVDDEIRLDSLADLRWLGFSRAESTAWYDQVVAVLRSHGIVAPAPAAEQSLIAAVKFAAVRSGRAFALAPSEMSHVLPEGVGWYPLAGHPLVRRTWALWHAGSRSHAVGALVAALERQQR